MLQALNNCWLFHTARTATSGSVQQDIGFSKANVKARSDINDSTKKVTNATKGYIGEKAVGFKSVFNVANAVWISTGYYTFRFARDSVLGMIVPIWCDINAAPTVSERTRFSNVSRLASTIALTSFLTGIPVASHLEMELCIEPRARPFECKGRPGIHFKLVIALQLRDLTDQSDNATIPMSEESLAELASDKHVKEIRTH